MKTSKKCSNKAPEQEQLASCQWPTQYKSTIFLYEAIIINVVKHHKHSVDAGQRFSYGNLEKIDVCQGKGEPEKQRFL